MAATDIRLELTDRTLAITPLASGLFPSVSDRIDRDVQIRVPLQQVPRVGDRDPAQEDAEHPGPVLFAVRDAPVLMRSRFRANAMIDVARKPTAAVQPGLAESSLELARAGHGAIGPSLSEEAVDHDGAPGGVVPLQPAGGPDHGSRTRRSPAAASVVIGAEAGLTVVSVATPEAADRPIWQVQVACDGVETLTGEPEFDDGPSDRDGDGAGHGMLLEAVRAEGRRSHSLPGTFQVGVHSPTRMPEYSSGPDAVKYRAPRSLTFSRPLPGNRREGRALGRRRAGDRLAGRTTRPARRSVSEVVRGGRDGG